MNLGILGYIWSLFYLVCHFNLKNSQNVKKNHMFSEMVHLRIHFVAKIICRLLYIQVCNLFSRLNWKKSPKMKNWCLSSNEISLEIGAHWQAYMTYGYFRHLRAAFFISFFFHNGWEGQNLAINKLVSVSDLISFFVSWATTQNLTKVDCVT